MGIFQTHPETENRINYVRNKLIEKGIEIDRRATTDYLKVSSKYILKDSFYTGVIYIDDIPVLSLSIPEREEIYLKMIETSQNLDRFLSIDLVPYEINVFVEGSKSTLLIRNNRIISLDDSETVYLERTAEEVLQETKNKIRQVLWEFRLNLPFDINLLTSEILIALIFNLTPFGLKPDFPVRSFQNEGLFWSPLLKEPALPAPPLFPFPRCFFILPHPWVLFPLNRDDFFLLTIITSS